MRFPSSTHEEPEALIPYGCYCYWPTGYTIQLCPFWAVVLNAPEQAYGYCHYLKEGDMTEPGTFLLWDMVKECDVNDEWDETDWMYGPLGEN